MLERKCENCDHVGNYRVLTMGGKHETPGMLVCRRYPPSPTMDYVFDKPRTDFAWPRVHATDRCGEFTPKEHSPTT